MRTSTRASNPERQEISAGDLIAERLAAQWLHPRGRKGSLVEAVRATCGVNAQLKSAMMLALRARVDGLTAGEVEDAIAARRTLVRTWAMRGTLHVMASADVPWLVGLLGPVFVRKYARRRLQLGLDGATGERALEVIRGSLRESSPLTRSQLVTALSERGVRISSPGQAPAHLVMYAALSGLICLGPDRGDRDPGYVLLDEWIGEPGGALPRPVALRRLACRYFSGYGPASAEDLAGWSGLTLNEARKGTASALEGGGSAEVWSGGRPLVVASRTRRAGPSWLGGGASSVRLLPAFDTYVLGYANRDDVVPPTHRAAVLRGGQVSPVVLVNGVAAGTWRHKRSRAHIAIEVNPVQSPTTDVSDLIVAEAEDIARFFDLKLDLRLNAPP